MRTCSWFLSSVVLSLAFGCTGVKSVYTEVPTDGVELVDYEGELKPQDMRDMDGEALVRNRAAEGYRLVGRAEFTVAGGQGWTEAMVRKGREIKAEKVDYAVSFDKTESGASLQDMRPAQSSVDPRADAGGADMSDMQAPGGVRAPVGTSIEYYVYHVYYFKRLKHPKK